MNAIKYGGLAYEGSISVDSLQIIGQNWLAVDQNVKTVDRW